MLVGAQSRLPLGSVVVLIALGMPMKCEIRVSYYYGITWGMCKVCVHVCMQIWKELNTHAICSQLRETVRTNRLTARLADKTTVPV